MLAVINLNEYKGNSYQTYINKVNTRFKISEKESTYIDYTREIKKFFKIEDMSQLTYDTLVEVKSDNVIEYLNTYIETGKSGNYVNKIRSSISKLYYHLITFSEEYEEEVGKLLFTKNPADTDTIKRIIKQGCEKKESSIPVITRDMINEYIKAVVEQTPFYKPKQKQRNLILVYLMFACGLRRKETINLKLKYMYKKVGDETIYIDVLNSKGNKSRTIDIPNKLAEMIDEYAVSYSLGGDDYVIGNETTNAQLTSASINSIIKKYDKYVTNRVNPHGFRHGFALELLNNDTSIYDISFLMGHSSEKTTKIYFSKMKSKKRNNIEI